MTIENDTSAVLIIEHHLSWFKPDCPDEQKSLNSVCRKRALHGGPVVHITVIMDRGLLELDGQADFFSDSEDSSQRKSPGTQRTGVS